MYNVAVTKADLHQAILKKMESGCAQLPLCNQPSDVVIGRGNLDAQIMFIGEAPGENEAIQRVPFVGRAGQLLNKTLSEIGLPREEVYVSNIVKARPPGNRDPLPDEIAAYLPYLLEEIELVQPKFFVSLGRFALNFFLPDAKISAVHGVLQRFWWQGKITYLLPQYHPAAALRGNAMMASFRSDMAKLPKALAYVQNQQAQDQEIENIKNALL